MKVKKRRNSDSRSCREDKQTLSLPRPSPIKRGGRSEQEADVVGKQVQWLIGAEIMFLFEESERRLSHTDTPCHRYSYTSCRQTSACIYRDSSAKNVSSVIIYSPPCYSKPVWLSFVEHKRWIFKESLFQYNESEWRLGLSSSKMTKSSIKYHKRCPYNCAIFHVFWSYILTSIVSIVCAFRSFSGLKASVPFIVIVWKSTTGMFKSKIQHFSLFCSTVVQVCNNIRLSN